MVGFLSNPSPQARNSVPVQVQAVNGTDVGTVVGDGSAPGPFESIRAGHDATSLPDDNILALCINNRTKIWVGVASEGVLCMPNRTNHRLKIRGVGESLVRPNAGSVVPGGDAAVNAHGDRFFRSASDGVERAKALPIVPVRPIGRICDER